MAHRLDSASGLATSRSFAYSRRHWAVVAVSIGIVIRLAVSVCLSESFCQRESKFESITLSFPFRQYKPKCQLITIAFSVTQRIHQCHAQSLAFTFIQREPIALPVAQSLKLRIPLPQSISQQQPIRQPVCVIKPQCIGFPVRVKILQQFTINSC